MLGHVNKLSFPHPKDSGPVASEKMFENVDGQTDGRQSDW